MWGTRRVAGVLFLTAALAVGLPGRVGWAQGTLAESGLIGEMEGATVLRDPAQWPKSFKEAPMLAELVKAGKLPPVEQRIPEEPMVIKPVARDRQVRRHLAARLHRPRRRRERQPHQRLATSCSSGTTPAPRSCPSVAKGWKLADDGKTFTLYLAQGHEVVGRRAVHRRRLRVLVRGHLLNKELVPTPIADMQPQGKPGRVVKVDETTVRFEFDVPYPLFEDMMAGDTLIGGGQSVRQAQKFTFGAYSPAHYLKQFLPKYSSVDEVNAKAKEAGFENWVQLICTSRRTGRSTPSCRRSAPGRRSSRSTRRPGCWSATRTTGRSTREGNQLPYIDRVQLTLAENLEVLNLRAIAGEYDLQERHIDIGKLPVILENQEKGNYTVHLDLGLQRRGRDRSRSTRATRPIPRSRSG